MEATKVEPASAHPVGKQECDWCGKYHHSKKCIKSSFEVKIKRREITVKFCIKVGDAVQLFDGKEWGRTPYEVTEVSEASIVITASGDSIDATADTIRPYYYGKQPYEMLPIGGADILHCNICHISMAIPAKKTRKRRCDAKGRPKGRKDICRNCGNSADVE